MPVEQEVRTAREAVGVFSRPEDLQNATVAAGAIVASGGTLVAGLAAATLAGAAGGLGGSILAKWIGDHHARYLQDQMDCGGLLLWVNTRDAALEKRAVEILKQHSAGDIHVHALPAAA